VIIHEHFTPGRAGLNVPLPVTQTVRKGRTLPRKKQRDRNMTALLKITYKAGVLLMAACTGLIVCSSCTDEEFMKGSAKTDKLSFGVSISDKWNAGPGTRSVEDSGTKYEAYKFDNSDMWIIASEEEGIENATFPEKKMETRGMPITNAKELSSVHKAFGVYAYHSNDDTFNQSVSYISNEEVSGLSANGQNTVQKWVAQSQHFWPRTGYMKFYAFSPSSISGQIKSENNTLKLDYTVPETSTEQPDILLALPQDPANASFYTCSEHKNVDLTFRHVLTAVKVRAAESVTGKIIKISISGVQGKGTLDADGIVLTSASLNENDKTEDKAGIGNNTWNIDNPVSSATFSTPQYPEYWAGIDLDATDIPKDANGTAAVVDNEVTFMLLPQELGDGVTLTVEFEDGNILTGKIGGDGKTWKMGYTYVYTISTSSIIQIFEVTPEVTIGKDGAKENYMVNSYELDTRTGDKTPLAWTVTDKKYYEDDEEIQNGAASYWSFANEQIAGGLIQAEEIRTISSNEMEPWKISRSAIFKEYDYGQDGGIRNGVDLYQANNYTTANCYMVHHAGEIKFPLVYGNAIKEGMTNSAAYTYSGKDVSGLTEERKKQICHQFIDGNGRPIKSALIDASNCEADIEWFDLPTEMMEVQNQSNIRPQNGDITLDGKSTKAWWITIRIRPEETIDSERPAVSGNILVSLRDKSTSNIVWSWHLWFTPYDPTKGLVTIGNNTFLPYNLGWCDPQTALYKQRKSVLTFVQTSTSKSQTMTVKQSADNVELAGYQPHYQWGRKEPMVAAGVGSKQRRTIYKPKYNGSTQYETTPFTYQQLGNQRITINEAMQYPKVFFGKQAIPADWETHTYLNLWNANESGQDNVNQTMVTMATTPLVKTVYDPCPPGFMVFAPQDVQGFGNIATEWKLNERKYGYMVHSLYLPYTGRSHDWVDEIDKTNEAIYWTCTREFGGFPNGGAHTDDDSRRCIALNLPVPGDGRESFQWHGAANGCAIRPMKEP